MTGEELKQIRRELAVAIKQQQRINQQITKGKISLAQLSAPDPPPATGPD